MPKLTRLRPSTIPLRVRLTLWYTASLGLILFLFAAFLYFQLQRSLLTQVDIGLQLAATQALINLSEKDEQLSFLNIENNPEVVRYLNDNYVIYLLTPDGSVWDQLGYDDELPPAITPTNGYTTFISNSQPWRVYNQPARIGTTEGWLQVVVELDPVEQILESLLTQMVFGVPAALGLAAVGGFFLAARALHPIDRITRTAQAINASDLHQRIGYNGPADEVGRLATTFDKMLTRLQAAFERERRFTGDAAHELRTPLAALKGRIGVTLSQPRQPTA